MKIKTITVSRGCTLNMGNYESLRLEVSMSADLDDYEDVVKACDELHKTVRSELEAQAYEVNKINKWI